MYSLYIPKYEDDPISAQSLPKALGRFMECAEYSYDLLVSPGYMSKTDRTIPDFLAAIEKEIAAGGRAIGLGLFHGMNGYNFVTRGTIIDEHKEVIRKAHHLENIEIDPKGRKDHRKMIFFFERGGWNVAEELNSRRRDDFLEAITVKAVLIGSSNFSLNTYYNGDAAGGSLAGKGEADLLMFYDENHRPEENFRRIIGQEEQGENHLDVGPEEWAAKMVLSESIAGGGDPQEYFKDMLRDFLEHSLN